MYAPPDGLTESQIVTALHAGWGLSGVAIEYVALGFGSHHWRVESATGRWFATVDDLHARCGDPDDSPAGYASRLDAAMRGARGLCDLGLDFVVAPLQARGGEVMVPLDERFVLALYPHVDGQHHDYGSYADPAARAAVVGLLGRLHSVPAAEMPMLLPDTFAVPGRTELDVALSELDTPWDAGPFAEPLRGLLPGHVDGIVERFARYDRLTAAANRPERFVVTHGEPHPANTITTPAGPVLIDWDTLLLAPPERDLWDLVGEDPDVVRQYTALSGRPLDDEALACYRLRWDVTEIAIYTAEFRRAHDDNANTRESWQNLQHYLGSGS